MAMITGSSVFSIDPVIQLMKGVIQEEQHRDILQTNLIPMEYLLQYITNVLDQLPEAACETLKVWLQLLHNCLTEAKSILHLSDPPQRCLDCLRCNPGRLSKQIKKWKVLFNYLFQALERDFLVFVRDREAVIPPVIAPVIPLMKDVIQEEENLHILQNELRPLYYLLLDISAVFQDQQKAAPEALKIWLQQLHNSLTEAKSILRRYDPSQRQRRLDCLTCNPGRPSKQVKEWQVLFNYLFQGLQEEFSMFVTADQMIINTDPTQLMSAEEFMLFRRVHADEAQEAEESTEESMLFRRGQPLSTDEAWMLFRGIAFKDKRVPMDIEEYGRNIAEECKAFPLAITLIAAAMRGKSRVDEWETCLSSMKNADPVSSFPDTLHPQIYHLLRWTYDALPNSDVKNCFLYCAMHPQGQRIYLRELVQMWIAEGLVRSKEESHLMDMAIGRSYVNLLVDRCFFHIATPEEETEGFWELPGEQFIRVEHDIREMAIYIGEKEENGLFKAGQRLHNFPTIHNDCKRISLLDNDIKNLPAELPCPKLVSLMLPDSIEEVPSTFLVSLTSLKVLRLRSEYFSSRINSIPSSVGQLKQLEFLTLQRLKKIEGLPEEICHLSSLQFLNLSNCKSLKSLPSKIGELKNLKYLSLYGCNRLKVIPHEISQLTSLSTLTLESSIFEGESEASIRRLKSLRNLTMLKIAGSWFDIMGTWLDMRHLWLWLDTFDLPHDMKNMKKLQSFQMGGYMGSSLPDYTYKFQHLEDIYLCECDHLRELSPLERLPRLKGLSLEQCDGLKELIIGLSGFLRLKKLVLKGLHNLESLAGPLNNGVWNESSLPKLSILKIDHCPNLKRLPVGMDKLVSLSMVAAEKEWWQQIIWEDNGMKIHLEKLFKEWKERFSEAPMDEEVLD